MWDACSLLTAGLGCGRIKMRWGVRGLQIPQARVGSNLTEGPNGQVITSPLVHLSCSLALPGAVSESTFVCLGGGGSSHQQIKE